jgi:dihydroorotase
MAGYRCATTPNDLSATPIFFMTNSIELHRPDDFHVHLRDGDVMLSCAAHTARQCGRALIMPNLKPPVTTVAMAAAYRDRILAATATVNPQFEPLMALYLTNNTSVDEIARVADSSFVHALKYYPAGATTNSDSGVTSLTNVYRVLEAMQRHRVVLCVHGEVVGPEVDVFDREAKFVDELLARIVKDFPSFGSS